MKKILVLATLFMLVIGCKPQSKDIKNISAEDLKVELKNDIQLLDVRTPKEWKGGIIEGAEKVSVTSDGFVEKANQVLDKSKPVYVYCKSGGRSLIASEMLLKEGYKVYNVEGGYMDWLDVISN